MKKCIKFFLIFGLVTVLIGVGTATAALALGAEWSWPYSRIEKRLTTEHKIPDTSQWEQAYQSFDATLISQLELDVGNGEINIAVDDSLQDEIRVAVSHSYASFGYETEDGKLKLEYQKHRGGSWDNDYEENQMQILIPKGFKFHKIDIELAAGILWAENLRADRMELEAGAGGIEIVDSTVGQLSMDAKAGGISYTGSVDGDVTAECKTGGIEMTLDGEKEDFNYNIECTMGFVEIEGESWAGFVGDSVYKGIGSKNMNLECKTGGIQVDFR